MVWADEYRASAIQVTHSHPLSICFRAAPKFRVFCFSNLATSGMILANGDTMSRIFEALKNAQTVRTEKLPPTPQGKAAGKVPDRRRARRWSYDIPVYVYGHGPQEEPFHEEAHTLHVNANGALLLLSVPVEKGQKLLLTNGFTQQEQDCQVVFLGTRRSRTIEAGVAFPQTNPLFWQIRSAPENKPAA